MDRPLVRETVLLKRTKFEISDKKFHSKNDTE